MTKRYYESCWFAFLCALFFQHVGCWCACIFVCATEMVIKEKIGMFSAIPFKQYVCHPVIPKHHHKITVQPNLSVTVGYN